jgi:hypothetical protein
MEASLTTTNVLLGVIAAEKKHFDLQVLRARPSTRKTGRTATSRHSPHRKLTHDWRPKDN